MDVGAWLRRLGRGQYQRAFRDNHVDADVLAELTADDLSGLGVASIGHRRKLLATIAALGKDTPSPEIPPAQTGPMPSIAGRLPVPRSTDAERRQLTVMFVDLVGSTALSTRLDPEDLREVIGAYQEAVAGEVARYEGHVAKFMGDGVLAYFGFPRSHEDDAERAVRTGLDILGAVGRLPAPEGVPLVARIGIATGLAPPSSQEQAVVGETPNLAARLQALAEPGSVVIAEGTRRLLGGFFEHVDLGAVEAKGFAEPIRAYRVIGMGTAASRFEAFHAAVLAQLVGREEEMDLLLRRWHMSVAAKAGWSCSRASRGSASHGCWRRCRSGSAMSRTPACTISARRTAKTAPCTHLRPSSSARRDSRTATPRRRGSRNCWRCWRRPRRPRRT